MPTLTRFLVAGVVLGAPCAFADGTTAAEALFQQGIDDLKAGHVEQACRELKASLDQRDDSGTEGALAECYGEQGKVASAWTLWRALADAHPDPSLRADAAARALALEPRLPHYAIQLAGAPPRGLAVKVNDTPVADPTLAVKLPIDPGDVVVVATAPGFRTWQATLVAHEGEVTTIAIPAFASDSAAPAEVVAHTQSPQAVEHPHTRAHVGLALGVAGVVALGVSGVLELQARHDYDNSGCDPDGGCQTTAQLQAAHSADHRAWASLGVGVAGAAFVGAGLALFLTAHGDARATPTTSFQLAPSAGGAVASWTGAF